MLDRTSPIAQQSKHMTPHFYNNGKLIALYVGDHNDTIELLDGVLGPQFAGG